MVLAVILLAVGADITQAEIVDIDFDGHEYVAGTLPPEPWMQEYEGTNHTIEAGVGYNGTQGLAVTSSENWAGVTYVLPTPMTSDMGAARFSVFMKPPSAPSGWFFADLGGLHVGRGEMRYGTSVANGLIFRLVSGNKGIYGPGAQYGTNMGSWTAGQWYEITFEVSQDWDTMTISAGPVGGTAVSGSFDWDGGDITRIWLSRPTANSAIYDNLLITAENGCPSGDLTGDCFVGMADLAVVGKWWLADCDEENVFCQGADFNSSGQVSVEDLAIIVLQWLEGDII